MSSYVTPVNWNSSLETCDVMYSNDCLIVDVSQQLSCYEVVQKIDLVHPFPTLLDCIYFS